MPSKQRPQTRRARRTGAKRTKSKSTNSRLSQSAQTRKVLAALDRMRRFGWPVELAAKLERIDPETVLRHVGKGLYRRGPLQNTGRQRGVIYAF